MEAHMTSNAIPVTGGILGPAANGWDKSKLARDQEHAARMRRMQRVVVSKSQVRRTEMLLHGNN